MNLEPVLQHAFEEGRNGNPARRTFSLHPLFFTNQRRAAFKIDIVNQDAKQLRPTSAGVGRECDHRVEEGLIGVLRHIVQELRDFWLCKEQAFPQTQSLTSVKAAAGNTAFDFSARLKWFFFVRLWIGQAAAGERPLNKSGARRPVPSDSQRCDFLLERYRRKTAALRAAAPSPLVEIFLQLLILQIANDEAIAKEVENVIEV